MTTPASPGGVTPSWRETEPAWLLPRLWCRLVSGRDNDLFAELWGETNRVRAQGEWSERRNLADTLTWVYAGTAGVLAIIGILLAGGTGLAFGSDAAVLTIASFSVPVAAALSVGIALMIRKRISEPSSRQGSRYLPGRADLSIAVLVGLAAGVGQYVVPR